MNQIKILGIGSPFGDDQAGWRVAEFLKQELFSDPLLTIESHDRPGVRLIELMNNASTVFLIDAVKSGALPGTIHRLKNNEIYDLNTMISTHDMGVAQALELGRSLNALPEHIILYGIEIDSVEWNVVISAPVARSIKNVVELIKDEINKTK